MSRFIGGGRGPRLSSESFIRVLRLRLRLVTSQGPPYPVLLRLRLVTSQGPPYPSRSPRCLLVSYASARAERFADVLMLRTRDDPSCRTSSEAAPGAAPASA